ncbi:type II toxin-antitoxin system RelE/ParE family toxin [Sphingorhabdus sp. IMCC26285]|uniref:Type II toxin-antitoxin system RelE/ParE family toxin n=1 Tax=Sphingorhabdus profundilacus TaxID=2509718 RepID=A0A6I4M7B3_9SPHN|nr:type II toxin-antitoxin system RelE/ParE family toxin [Sphingorhabdus profundilacus]MVZ98598.1 type II toxin-antitoxin system RelE/ParE family toxin [Sphingorhabdus profundilacus]
MTHEIDKPQFVLYDRQVIEIRETIEFRYWLDGLRDRKARLRIDDRIRRLAAGNPGDAKSVGDGVQELRFKFGPGYRVYYVWVGTVLVLLLTGGDKDSQVRDIVRAKQLAKEVEDGVEDTPL